ncbi:MAG: ferrous iron transport protein B [Planctomycetaceae bacterium]|nr:ferrous iron transport protein B [Planctomycetaceae bacterium]MCP4476831.1 ferrous iron transport protein B [Planctomycetaceae bacterium]MCP4773638.1 ferrous iron transport protein B [Planctomycetaceae bacterium]
MSNNLNEDDSAEPTAARVAVLGNPNTGKSTLFNALTGIRQQTGNYPGVTVEKRTGLVKIGPTNFELTDLPGTYSLAPRSPDEMLTVNVLLGEHPAEEKPDLILCVVDANNLERNLFLVSQILDLHQPMIIAVNMTDIATRNGIEIELETLQKLLGVPVVGIQAKRRVGFDALKSAMASAVSKSPDIEHDPFSDELKQRIGRLKAACPDDCQLKRFAVTRMLFDTDGFMTDQLKSQVDEKVLATLKTEQEQMQSEGHSIAESESHARYNWITKHLDSFVKRAAPAHQTTLTDRLDAWLTHPFWGLLFAGLTMVILFQLVFWAAEPASNLIDGFNGVLATAVNSFVPEGTLNSLLIDGLINGVGSVLIFLPQILLLFFILAILEDTGYLSRAAFLLDKYLSRIGLSGITLFPLLSSFACAIPGIMATRVIKDRRERLITMLIAPLMSCSARLPVYVLLIAAFVPSKSYLGGLIGLQGLTMFGMYMVGIITAVAVAWLLRKTILKTGTSSFVLELPTYKLPSLRNVWQRMFDGGWAFVRDAGTMIVVVTILVWAAAYFPQNNESLLPPPLKNDAALIAANQTTLDSLDGSETSIDVAQLEEQVSLAQNRLDAYQLEHSYLGRTGKLIEPMVKPLGWDWRIGSAAIASFPAREVIVSTMGVIFGLGADTDEESDSLKSSLASATWEGTDRPLFTLPVALSIMVFFALCAQCVSTLAVIQRETNSYRWPIFTFAYMTILAYVAAFLTFQISDKLL